MIKRVARITALAALAAVVVGVGPVDAQGKQRRKQSLPISLGTSGGNDTAFNVELLATYCASSTLGALLNMEDEGETSYFILSTNSNLGQVNMGDPGEDLIIQPGLAQTNCNLGVTDEVGVLAGFKKIKFAANKTNTVDVAIGATNPDLVKTNGQIIQIGQVATEPVKPEVGMLVKKSGGGTGLTRGVIAATNFKVQILYTVNLELPPVTELANFKKQLLIVSNNPNKPVFASGGDTGALVVEDKDNCPAPLGMVIATDQTGAFAIVNKANEVLKAVNKIQPKGPKTFVGCEPAATAASASVVSVDPRLQRRAVTAQRRLQRGLRSSAGIVGTGLTADANGHPMVLVVLEKENEELRREIPEQINGIATDVLVTGPFLAH